MCQHKLNCIHCKKCHPRPSILHIHPRQSSDTPVTSSESDHNNNSVAIPFAAVSSNAHMWAGGSVRQATSIIPVRLKSKFSDKFVNTYAFLDSGSTATFCSEEIVKSLHIEGKRTVLNLMTMGQHRTENCFIISNLELSNLKSEKIIELPSIYTQQQLPVSKRDIVTMNDLQRWPHLSSGEFFLMFNVFSLFCYYRPLEKGIPLHLMNLTSFLKDDLCQFWLKLDQWFLRRFWMTPLHFYMFNIISTLAKTWPFIGQSWIQFIQGKYVPSLIDFSLLVLEKNVFKTFQCISTLLPLSTIYPLKKGVSLHLNKLESPPFKDDLSQFCLNLAQ
jgi:hypothetical protein